MAKRRKRNRSRKGHTLRNGGRDVGAQTETAHAPQQNHRTPSRSAWAGPDGPVGSFIARESHKTLEAYRNQPNLVAEHANHEEDTARGGYAHRQLFELVQNSADSLAGSGGGRIWIRLTPTHLYCADEGRPIDESGVTALMFSHLSSKRGTTEIGRFGLGFKSVLGVTDSPEFFSWSGSFRFDRTSTLELIRPVAPASERYPVLRLPEPLDPWPIMEFDPILRDLMGWAVNIVRLPLKPGAHEGLGSQIRDFPPEFLLFVDHVSELVLQNNDQRETRKFSLHRQDGLSILDDGNSTNPWMVTKAIHNLSPDARSDSRSLDDAEEVPISWAAPLHRVNEPGKFWAFFPTMTTSLLSGILNAPWKTNEDRQNLLSGLYNDELIDAAAQMVASALPRLSTPEDPALHLDTLPRRREAGDNEHSERLRDQLHSHLQSRDFVPDQDGRLRQIPDISYPPRELTRDGQMAWDSLNRWAAYADRPSDWLHHTALNRNRLATLERIIGRPLARAPISDWLRALIENATAEADVLQAAMATTQTAALIPETIRGNHNSLGNIVLTADGTWAIPDPDTVFLGGDNTSTARNLVHPQLQTDPETLDALKKLGIKPASAESVFRELALSLLGPQHNRRIADDDWDSFWRLARDVDPSVASDIIRKSGDNWRDLLRVYTVDGKWRSLFQALLPGRIVPEDGSRDSNVAIDSHFHDVELLLLQELGAAESPSSGWDLPADEYRSFINQARKKFHEQDLPSNPRDRLLRFKSTTASGPLDVLQHLSEEGRVLYTEALLELDDTYKPWTMHHKSRPDAYPEMEYISPWLVPLILYGRIRTDEGIERVSDGCGDPPRNPAVWRKLLSHPKATLIRQMFKLQAVDDAPIEPVGADTPVPLVDVWPGLNAHLSIQQKDIELVRCDGFQQLGEVQGHGERDCIIKDGYIYITRKDDEQDEISSVLRELGLQLDREHIERILLGLTNTDVRAARDKVRQCSTDEERLLVAVGETELRRRLPSTLITILERNQGPVVGIRAAMAAIATFHTGALREYRDAMVRLDPPKQWAGSQRAVEFVRSLGFGEEWAGERNPRREPYVEVEGPYSLPELHDYQRKVVRNVRRLLHSSQTVGERRGMISMPTGSGKTRVAVQSVVEAIREDGFRGGILWVADRDELCEQAVEAWRQVWASEGAPATQLRISRMWAGQPPPLPTGDMHVIVATIQTLSAKISRQPDSYEFLADFKLLVFDEAHRSVAPIYTSVMQELGLTRWRRSHEPLLIGLTATPYRGHDVAETERLVNRYGSNRLDSGAFASDDPEDVIRELQTMRILAQADHDTIEGGQFSMSDDELRQSRETPWLPRSVEERISYDTGRTQRIVQAYDDHIDPNWPTLIFATSVEHAQTVAALLASMGVKARAVSAATDASSRRRIVEEFRAGEIKALVNYGIFREGFDAPKTRAIIVARPVYSPNLYFQMIGRGLRGVKNGGNDRCLIINVRDNIDNFERKLAFSELDWLWA